MLREFLLASLLTVGALLMAVGISMWSVPAALIFAGLAVGVLALVCLSDAA